MILRAYSITVMTVAIGLLPLAAIVGLRAGKDMTRIVFSACLIAIAWWSFGVAMHALTATPRWAMFWSKFLHVGAIFIPVTYLHFTLAFLGKKQKYLIPLLYVTSLTFLVLLFTSDKFIAGIGPVYIFLYFPMAGSLYGIFLFQFAACVISSVLLLGYAMHNAKAEDRRRIAYVFWGSIIGYAFGPTAFLPMYKISVLPFGVPLVLIYGILITIAIRQHHLMNVPLIARDWMIQAATVGLVGAVCLLVSVPVATKAPLLASVLSIFMMGSLMLVAYDPIRRFVQPAIDRLVFANRFGYLEELSQLPNDMLEFTNLSEMLKFLVTRLKEAAKLEQVRIFMYDPGHQSYVETMGQAEETDGSKEEPRQLAETDPLVQLLRTNAKLWTQEDFSQGQHQDAQTELKALRGAACFPVNKEKDLLGVVVLGRKQSGESFNQQDLKILRALRVRLENFLGQAMVITQEALNMVKDSHDMKNDVNALKGRITWRAMRTAGWKMDLEKQTKILDGNENIEQVRSVVNQLKIQAMEWFQEADRSRGIEDQAIQRLSHRLKNWAEYGRVISEGFRGSRAMEAIEVGEAAKYSVERWRPHAEKKKLQLSAQTSPNLVVWGERSLVEQVIENLIDNAIKATTEGKVDVVCRSDLSGVLLEVKDSGCGIAPEDLRTIFEKPFYQGKGRENLEQSTGVGLYLVAQYVRSLGGKVWAESQVGKGSSFFVQLPKHTQERERAGVAA